MVRYPKEIKEKARALYASGMKVQAIANELGLTYNCVYQWVTANSPATNGDLNLKLTTGLMDSCNEACKLLAQSGCPIIFFNRDGIKRNYIVENVCPLATNCSVDKEQFTQCWANYLVQGNF